MYQDNDDIDTNSTLSKNSDEIFLNIESNVSIENVEEENNLIHYTENHFHTKITQDLEKIRELNLNGTINNNSFYKYDNSRSNSPVTISNNGSGSDSDSNNNHSNNNEYDHDKRTTISNMGYKKLSYSETLSSINKYYDLTIDNKFSTEIDILTTYIKAQKNLFIQSTHITKSKLNCLMFPSLFISSFIVMIAPFVVFTNWGGALISALNATIMLCISLINYLKLESAIEIYLQNAKQYDKIETSLEMTNSKLLFIDHDKEKTLLVLNKIREIEKKMNEIKESTTILIPLEIKLLFPIICHINIFSFIKKIEIYKKNLILKFKDVKNEIRYILYKSELNKSLCDDEAGENNKHKNRLQFLYEVKDKLKNEIFDFQSAYSQIDSIFTREIKNAESKKNTWVSFTFWNKSTNNSYSKGMNPMIDKYFHFIFVDE